MPPVQRGQLWNDGAPGDRRDKRAGQWRIRWRDEHGRRRQKSGFRTKEEAEARLARELERTRLGPALRRQPDITVAELVERFLAQHQAEPATIERLRYQLAKATAAFGRVKVRELRPEEIGVWRSRLGGRSAYDTLQAFRQVLGAGVRWRYLEENPAKAVPNPQPKRKELRVFASWDELEKLLARLASRDRAIVVFAAGTGLRPEEWLALERRDVDREERVVHVRRALTRSGVHEWGKTERSRRTVPLRQRVLDELEALPPRIDSPFLFPGDRGGHIDLPAWRRNRWMAKLEKTGLESRPPYALRHTYAAWSIAAGVNLFTLARRMGTSVAMVDRTYGHLLPDAKEYELDLLDAFDVRPVRREAGELADVLAPTGRRAPVRSR